MSNKNEKLTLLDHLAELRKRLVIIVVVNLLAAIISFQFSDVIIQYILNLNQGMELVYIQPAELFVVYVKMALTCGIIVSMPITLLQIWMFISKGLYTKEKIYIVLALTLGTIFFVIGVLFCYNVVLPTTLEYFVRITISEVSAMISVNAFTSFVNTMLLCFGAVFEMPIVVFLLSIMGILKPQTLIKKQSIFIIAIFIVSAFITPPDMVSQVLLAIPMVLLFELSIGICWIVNTVRERKQKIQIG